MNDIKPETNIVYMSYVIDGSARYNNDAPFSWQFLLNKQNRVPAVGSTADALPDMNQSAVTDYSPTSDKQWNSSSGVTTVTTAAVPNSLAYAQLGDGYSGLRRGQRIHMRKLRLQFLIYPPMVQQNEDGTLPCAITRWKIMLVRVPKANNDQPKTMVVPAYYAADGSTFTSTYNEPLLGYPDFYEPPFYGNVGQQTWIDSAGSGAALIDGDQKHRMWWPMQKPRQLYGPYGGRSHPQVIWQKKFKTWNRPTDVGGTSTVTGWLSGGASMSRDEKEFRVNIKLRRGAREIVYDDDYPTAMGPTDTGDARPQRNGYHLIVWNDCPSLPDSGTVNFGVCHWRGFWTFTDSA